MDNDKLLAEIYTDVKWIKDEIKELKEDTKQQLKDHDDRIAKLEEFKYKVMGALIVIYFIVSGILIYLR